MRVQEVMTRKVETISAAESAENARQRMRTNRTHHLVATRGAEVVGVISARDLDSLGSFRQVRTVEDVMASPVVTGTPDMTIRQAANLLRGRTIGCLPVVDGGKLVGILTITDLLEMIGRGIDRPRAGERRVMKGRGPRRGSVVGHKGFAAH